MKRRIGYTIFSLFAFACCRADTWTWDPAQSGGASPGGPGDWDAAGTAWWNGSAPAIWTDDPAVSAAFTGTPGTVAVQGQRVADGVTVGGGFVLSIAQSGLANRLTVHGDLTGAGQLLVSGDKINDRYADTLMQTGLRFEGGAAQTLDLSLTAANLNASQIVTVSGENTVATVTGSWRGDGGNAFPHLFTRDGGRLVIGEGAELDFVNDAYFTRQLWIKGQGPDEALGAIEFAAGFVADRSAEGTVPDGLGSIRLNHAVVVTRHSRSIPVHFRPRPGHPDGPQINGHFVFEYNPGLWIVRENPQRYAGAMWFRTNAEIRTEQDLTHVGVTQDDTVSAYPYRAGNAFQTQEENLTITKTGPAALILAGEQAYKPGTVMRVTEGMVRFRTDPATGFFHNSVSQPKQASGPDLNLVVEADGAAEFSAPASEIASLDVDGDLHFVLGAGDGPVKLRVHGDADISGTLHLWTAPGFAPAPGTQVTLVQADALTYAPAAVKLAPGVNATVQVTGGSVTVTFTAVGDQGLLLDEPFDSLAAWDDLSTAVTWTSTPDATTVFQTTSDGGASSVLNLNDASRSVAMWGDNGIRSYSAIDHRFAAPVAHRDSELTVEFRMRWEKLEQKNERDRVVFTLIHDYPEGGLDLTPDARVDDLSDHWWGRPAYQVRLRSDDTPIPGSTPIFLYGGGHDIEGEFEQGDGEWRAGFSSAANGTSPGVGSPYPDNSWALGDFSPVSTDYQRYRYVVKPNVQELWVNEADDGQTWTLVGDMPLPFEEDAPSTAPLYRYFEQLEGLRIYFRSPGTGSEASNVYLDWVRVTVEDAVTGPTFADWAADNGLPAGQDGPGDDPYGHGVSNLERYAFGLPASSPPSASDRPRLVASPGDAFSFRRPLGGRGDIDYQVWLADDLTAGDWIRADPTAAWEVETDGDAEVVRVRLDGLENGPRFAALALTLTSM